MFKKIVLVNLFLCHNAIAHITELAVPGGIKKIVSNSKTQPTIKYKIRELL